MVWKKFYLKRRFDVSIPLLDSLLIFFVSFCSFLNYFARVFPLLRLHEIRIDLKVTHNSSRETSSQNRWTNRFPDADFWRQGYRLHFHRYHGATFRLFPFLNGSSPRYLETVFPRASRKYTGTKFEARLDTQCELATNLRTSKDDILVPRRTRRVPLKETGLQ